MNLELIQKLLIGVFGLFLIFIAVILLVGTFISSPLFSTILFIAILYIVYYIALKLFFKDS